MTSIIIVPKVGVLLNKMDFTHTWIARGGPILWPAKTELKNISFSVWIVGFYNLACLRLLRDSNNQDVFDCHLPPTLISSHRTKFSG